MSPNVLCPRQVRDMSGTLWTRQGHAGTKKVLALTSQCRLMQVTEQEARAAGTRTRTLVASCSIWSNKKDRGLGWWAKVTWITRGKDGSVEEKWVHSRRSRAEAVKAAIAWAAGVLSASEITFGDLDFGPMRCSDA